MIQNEMNVTASVEDALALTLAALRDAKARMRPVFGQERIATSAGHFLETLLGNEPRKTGWMRAEAAGVAGPGALGCRCATRCRARSCGGSFRRSGCGSGDRRDRFSQEGRGLLRREPTIHWLGEQNHQLPDRRVRDLRFTQRTRLSRPGAVSAEKLDRYTGTAGSGACARRYPLCHQAVPGNSDDPAGIGGRGAVRLGCR